MPKDTFRIEQLQGEFRKNIGKSWSIELLDTLLLASQELNYREGELEATLGYCDYYGYKSDVPAMLHWFERLKELSYQYNQLDLFFRKWRIISDYKIKQGQSEAVLLEARRVKSESIERKQHRGVFYANITIATALDMVENFDEAFKVYDELLADQSINLYEKAEVHWIISKTYLKTDQSQKAIDEINHSTNLLLAYYNQHQEIARNNDKLLEKEIGLCRIYARTADTINLYKHLKRAEHYYTPHSYPSLKLSYCNHWTQYYTLKEDWEESLKRFDITFALFDGTMPLYEMSLYIDKANVLFKAKRFKEAAETYREAAIQNDSINQKIIAFNEETLQANQAINQALLERSSIERKHNRLKIMITSTFCLLLISILGKKLYSNKKLKRKKEESKQLLEAAQLKNSEKEDFLRNISHQIRIPLHTVVGLSEILTYEIGISDEEKNLCAQNIKKDATQLSELVYNVLYLSRLESGAMRLEINKYNIAQICKEAMATVIMRETIKPNIEFINQEEIIAETDYGLFLKIITMLITEKATHSNLKIELFVAKRYKHFFNLTIEVSNLYNQSEREILLLYIYKAFAKRFNGTYKTQEKKDSILFIFELPFKYTYN